MADGRRAAFSEAFFPSLCVISLGGFWLGSLRGLLVGAPVPADVGLVTRVFSVAAPILLWELALLAVVAEVLCGYKFYKTRQQLYSPIAVVSAQEEQPMFKSVNFMAQFTPWKPKPKSALGGQVKTDNLVGRVNTGNFPAAEASELCFVLSSVRKSVCTFVRELRGPHFSPCA